MSELRGIEQGQAMSVSVEVIAAEVRLMKEDLGRRLDELAQVQRDSRAEVASNYVHHQAYQAEYGRLTDRIANVEADVVEIRTSLSAQFIDIHGHIDRKFAELVVSRRWFIGLVVTVVLALLGSATAVGIAVVSTR